MSTETLTKLNPKILINSNLNPKGSEKQSSDPKELNIELNAVQNTKEKSKDKKICVKKMHDRLKKIEMKEKFENRILSGLFLSLVAVIFFIVT